MLCALMTGNGGSDNSSHNKSYTLNLKVSTIPKDKLYLCLMSTGMLACKFS